MKELKNQSLESVSGGGLPAVLIYAAARKAVKAGVKHYAKRSAQAAGGGAVAGGTSEALSN